MWTTNSLIVKYLSLILLSPLMFTKCFRFSQFNKWVEGLKLERLFCVQTYIKKSLRLLPVPFLNWWLKSHLWAPRSFFLTFNGSGLLSAFFLLYWCLVWKRKVSQMYSSFTSTEIVEAAYFYKIKPTYNMCHPITFLLIQNK